MHPLSTPQSAAGMGFPVRAAGLFDSVFREGALTGAYAERFDLLAAPGQALPELRPGDLILQRALAAPPAAELVLIADPAGRPASRAARNPTASCCACASRWARRKTRLPSPVRWGRSARPRTCSTSWTARSR